MSARTYCDLCKTYHEPCGCVMSRGLENLFGHPFSDIERRAMAKRIAELQAELDEAKKLAVYWERSASAFHADLNVAEKEIERLDGIILNANKERCKYE